jgi:hypothetical protein
MQQQLGHMKLSWCISLSLLVAAVTCVAAAAEQVRPKPTLEQILPLITVDKIFKAAYSP